MKPELASRLLELTGEAVSEHSLPFGSGVLPKVAPSDEQSAAEVLRWASTEGLRVLPLGSGSRLASQPPSNADLVVSCERLVGVVEHEPADGTLTVRAGTPLREVQEAAKAHGHEVAPLAWHGTVGGALAHGADGHARSVTGPARDHVLGARLALPNGDLVRSGGRLVKNVTGYDLHRLAVGARGTTGIVTEVTLRLLTAPIELCRLTLQAATFEELHGIALDHLRGTTPARSCAIVQLADGRHLLEATFGGTREAVEDALAPLSTREPTLEWGVKDDCSVVRLAERSLDAPSSTRLSLSDRPSRQAAGWRELHDTVDPDECALVAEPLIGRLTILHRTADGDRLQRTLEHVRRCSQLVQASLRWEGVDPGIDRQLAQSLHAPAMAAAEGARASLAQELSGRIRGALDPAGTLSR
ncbi:MAG: FAD-binding oxidoreductase [Planctomycetota bacterium]